MRSQKETAVYPPLHGKWYDDACGAAYAMELIGERWTLPIVRELMLGGRRFSDIRASLPAISAKVLTERLESLEAAGIVAKVTLADPVPARLYTLTPWGLQLETVMQALGRWSVQSPGFNPRLPLTPVSLMLSMRTMLVPAAAADWQARFFFDVGGTCFTGVLEAGNLAIARASVTATAANDPITRDTADVALAGPDANAYLPVLYGKRGLDDPEVRLEARGEPDAIARFIGLFALPARRASPD